MGGYRKAKYGEIKVKARRGTAGLELVSDLEGFESVPSFAELGLSKVSFSASYKSSIFFEDPLLKHAIIF
jgi:hypothetical protein